MIKAWSSETHRNLPFAASLCHPQWISPLKVGVVLYIENKWLERVFLSILFTVLLAFQWDIKLQPPFYFPFGRSTGAWGRRERNFLSPLQGEFACSFRSSPIFSPLKHFWQSTKKNESRKLLSWNSNAVTFYWWRFCVSPSQFPLFEKIAWLGGRELVRAAWTHGDSRTQKWTSSQFNLS